MKVPFTTADFCDRAELCYGDRIGVVDEPGPFQDGGLGSLTYGALAGRARRWPPGSTSSGSGAASGSRSSATTARRLLESFFGVCTYGRVLVPINFRLSPAEVEYIVEHSGASVLLSSTRSSTTRCRA